MRATLSLLMERYIYSFHLQEFLIAIVLENKSVYFSGIKLILSIFYSAFLVSLDYMYGKSMKYHNR